MFKVFDIEVKPGTKLFTDITVSDSFGNNTLLPLYIINGAEKGPVICITSGVHGTEYPGIAANLKIYNEIDPNSLKGIIIGCPMCNYEAFITRTMFVNPLDRKNLNDVFPGKAEGTITEVIAYTLLNKIVPLANYHIDMHSGDSIEYLHPYVFYHKNSKGNLECDDKARSMALVYGLDYIAKTELEGNGASDRGNFYSSVSEMGIPCIQPEIGGIGLVEERTKMLHYNGAFNVLKSLSMIDNFINTTSVNQVELQSFYRLKSSNDGVFNTLVSPGERIFKGDKLANITDYHGEKELEFFEATEDGVVLWVMSCLSVKNGDTLMAIGVI